mmetsp:Transcript_11645/g.33644  ORF Transcript_11645/g.33644 Transcript_11645/m.33644 type:complete len:82 (+) Transcript_11645:147-392(+)
MEEKEGGEEEGGGMRRTPVPSQRAKHLPQAKGAGRTLSRSHRDQEHHEVGARGRPVRRLHHHSEEQRERKEGSTSGSAVPP